MSNRTFDSNTIKKIYLSMCHYLILQGFTGRDGKLDYDKLFNSLHNRSFRRRWLKTATLYLSDWANYIAEPEVYNRYASTYLFEKLFSMESNSLTSTMR